MKNILIFSTAYLPFIGGAEIAVKEITDRLGQAGAGNGYIFDLITARLDRKLPKLERIGNVNVFRIGLGNIIDKFILPLSGLILALRLDRKNKYKIAVSIMASQAGIAAAFLNMINPKIKLLVNLQEGDEEAHLMRYVFGSRFLFKLLILPLARLVIKKADHITVISNYLKDRAIKSGAMSVIEVIPNGVDINKFKIQNSKFKINEIKKELGFDENDKLIVTVSRLVEKNGVDDLIRAMSFLANINYRLLIIGTGENESKLISLTENLKLQDRVRFLGRIEHEEIPKYLWISDVFARPSLSEGLGNVFLEAMAAGIPVIGTPVGGILDFLVDGETGLFCQTNNPKDLAEKIKVLLSDGLLAEKIRKNCLKLVEEKYNWESISANYDILFRKLALA